MSATYVTHLHDGRILLAALYELVVCQLRVLVPVHVLEDLVYALWNEQCSAVLRRSSLTRAGGAPFLAYPRRVAV